MSNKKITLEDIKKIDSFQELIALGIGEVMYDVSHRGGKVGFYGQEVAYAFELDPYLLSPKYGVYVNYLGGGLRGSICSSGYSKSIPADKALLLDALAEACKRVYLALENEQGLNEETYPDGDTNWEALGTNRAREAEIKAAY